MILLDTHALVWWQAGSERLPRRLRERIDAASSVHVSAVSCWEVATLVARGRIRLDRPLRQWVSDMGDPANTVTLVPLDPFAAVLAADLDAAGFHPDPADRLLYAPAHGLGVPFATADARMRRFASDAPTHLRVACVWT